MRIIPRGGIALATDVEAGRDFVEAYVASVHFVEALQGVAIGSAHDHGAEHGGDPDHGAGHHSH